MSSFEKLCCAFDENFVRCAHYRVCNANSPATVELCARNGTQMEPRLRTNDAYFKTLTLWAQKRVGKCRVLGKLDIWAVKSVLKINFPPVRGCASR